MTISPDTRTCPICSSKFTSTSILQHIRSEHKDEIGFDEKMTCPYCKVMVKRKNFNKHIKKVHLSERELSPEEQKALDDYYRNLVKQWEKEFDQFTFPTKEELRRHRERSKLYADLKHRIRTRDKNQCVNCGSTKNLEFDHKIPISKGGKTTFNNVQLLCRSCNRRKRDRIL